MNIKKETKTLNEESVQFFIKDLDDINEWLSTHKYGEDKVDFSFIYFHPCHYDFSFEDRKKRFSTYVLSYHWDTHEPVYDGDWLVVTDTIRGDKRIKVVHNETAPSE